VGTTKARSAERPFPPPKTIPSTFPYHFEPSIHSPYTQRNPILTAVIQSPHRIQIFREESFGLEWERGKEELLNSGRKLRLSALSKRERERRGKLLNKGFWFEKENGWLLTRGGILVRQEQTS